MLVYSHFFVLLDLDQTETPMDMTATPKPAVDTNLAGSKHTRDVVEQDIVAEEQLIASLDAE